MVDNGEIPGDEVDAFHDFDQGIAESLAAQARARGGVIGYDRIVDALAQGGERDRAEEVVRTLADMGFMVAPSENAAGSSTESRNVDMRITGTRVGPERREDTLRMYLREMGSVELLSRDGETAIAKRIEIGRKVMYDGLCRNPLTGRAITNWHVDLDQGRASLRDVVELGTGLAAAGNDPEIVEGEAQGVNARAAARAASIRTEAENLIAEIANTHDRLSRLRMESITVRRGRQAMMIPSRLKNMRRLERILIGLISELQLNRKRIEDLIAETYSSESYLVSLEGQLIRSAREYEISRKEFLDQWRGNELATDWLGRVSGVDANWKRWVSRERPAIKRIRQEIGTYCEEVLGQDVGAFRGDSTDRATGRTGSTGRKDRDGERKSPPRHLHRQEVHQPGTAHRGSHSGGQYRVDEGCRQVRVAAGVTSSPPTRPGGSGNPSRGRSPTRHARSGSRCT